MGERIIIKPLNEESKSDSVYRTVKEAFVQYHPDKVFVNEEYMPWIFELSFKENGNVNPITLTLSVVNLGEVVYSMSYLVSQVENEDAQFDIAQDIIWKVCGDIDDFWEKKKAGKL